jgi:hypothetical protein
LLKRELGSFVRHIKDDGSALLWGYVETNDVDVVPIYDGSEKRRLEVDGKSGSVMAIPSVDAKVVQRVTHEIRNGSIERYEKRILLR